MNKRVLFITVVDMYDKHGNGGVKGSQRNFRLLQSCFGEENVILASFPRTEYTVPPTDAITFKRTQNNFEHLIAALLGCKVYFPWKEKEIFRFIREKQIDLLFIDSSMLGRMARIKGNFKKLVFFHNVEAEYAYNKVKNEGWKYLPSYWASKKNEVMAMKYADSVVCLNQRDLLDLKRLYGREADSVLPVTLEDEFDMKRCRETEQLRNRLLFVGAFMPQNIASIEWFIKDVMIYLPEITLDIVGRGFEKKKEEYSQYKNINIIGGVDDLGEHYYAHSIVVLPIQYGAGMKIKTAEAMMYGRMIIASDEALEGYEVEDVNGIFRCNTAEAYLQTIRKLLSENTFEQLALEVRQLFMDKYETNRIACQFSTYIGELLQMENRI